MAVLLEIREQLKAIYSRFDVYIVPVLKFVLAYVVFTLINRNLGYMTRLNNTAIMLIVALLCSFLPLNVMIVLAALFCVLHIYALSMECAVVVMVIFLLMFLLYFRFSPGDAIAVVLTPVSFMMGIPYTIPLAMGFVGSPLSAISVGCGVVVHYVLKYVIVNSSVLGNLEADSTIQKFKYIVDNLLANRELIVMAMAFAVTIVIVYIIRRLSVDYSWTIALVIGTITDVVLVLAGAMVLELDVSVGSVIVGSIISALLILILQFFVFSVDYSRTEHLQFEDDEYYYYVKAVPKMSMSVGRKKVKKINSRRDEAPVRQRPAQSSVSRPAKPATTAARPAQSPAARPAQENAHRPAASAARPAQPVASRVDDTANAEGWRRVDPTTRKL